MKQRSIHSLVCIGVLSMCGLQARGDIEYPGPPPGDARARISGTEIVLRNNAIVCRWSIRDGHLQYRPLIDTVMGLGLGMGECFQLFLADGHVLKASDLKIAKGPDIENLKADLTAGRLAGRYGGKQIHATLTTPDGDLEVRWRVELRDESNYVRQYISLVSKKAADIREIVLVQLKASEASREGTLDGCPVTVANLFFFAFEHPLAKIRRLDSELRCSLLRGTPLKPGDEQTYSSVIGALPSSGQLRRAFLYYVERERAHAYRPFLHYNSWYDIGYGGAKILEGDALKVIDLFGTELIERRNVTLDSFVLDDGWDNPATLWQFHDGLPNGFTPLLKAAAQYGSTLGVWLSPWGGYGQSKEQRMKYGQQEGFETNKRGFSMGGPKYYGRFRDACMKMLRDYRVNYFKFDGISSGGTPMGADPEYAGDVEALLRLIAELRAAKRDVFINVTTGTWSSPYWLWYADSTWRSGSDWSMCGWGSKRQKQITYRDNETYHNVVQRAPLYPINSLMTQGVMFGNHGLPDEPQGLVEDIHAFFAGGTDCQELYLTPSLLDAKVWDALAEAARWSRDNADVLVDTHWIGGDPIKGEVYGWASWAKRKGIIALRNPSDKPGRIAIDIGKAFELPPGAAQKYSLKSPWKSEAAATALELSSGQEHTFDLKPFEVLVYDGTPL